MPDPARAIPPPPDFAACDLPIEAVPEDTAFVIHRTSLGALHFGTSGDGCFDDPRGEYGVCYAARSLEGAFAETCLRAVGATLVPLALLALRSATVLSTTSKLRLVELHGPGLARLGATAAVSSGGYDVSQPWSRAIHDHPVQADGIVHRSNHDDGELCVALFDRCRHGLAVGAPSALTTDRVRLAALLDRYDVGLS